VLGDFVRTDVLLAQNNRSSASMRLTGKGVKPRFPALRT
jgi:hypothetical protein